MTQPSTNASNTALASNLSGLPLGRFVGLITQKKGKTCGRGAAKALYGDDIVHVVLFTGFRYPRLVERSRAKALAIGAKGLLAECERQGKTGKSGAPITIADCTKALDDFVASCDRTLGGQSTSTTDHVYDPLVVDGETVRGCRVYVGGGDPNDPKAPVPGTIYLQGLKIGQKVLTPAPNGPIPASDSRGDVVAKTVLRYMTPLGRYVSYALEPGSGFIMKAGGTAVDEASKAGVTAQTGADADVAEALSDDSAEQAV